MGEEGGLVGGLIEELVGKVDCWFLGIWLADCREILGELVGLQDGKSVGELVRERLGDLGQQTGW